MAAVEHSRWICKCVCVCEGGKCLGDKLQQIWQLSQEDVLTFSNICVQPSGQVSCQSAVRRLTELHVHIRPADGKSALLWERPTSCAEGCGHSAWLPTQALSQPSLIPLHRQRRKIRLTHSAATLPVEELRVLQDWIRSGSTKSLLSASWPLKDDNHRLAEIH